jgi:hypothetical protein
MLAGDESVVEPWLLGWCWVVVRAGGDADSMPYCSVGERGDSGKQIWTLDALVVPFIEPQTARGEGHSHTREDDTTAPASSVNEATVFCVGASAILSLAWCRVLLPARL